MLIRVSIKYKAHFFDWNKIQNWSYGIIYILHSLLILKHLKVLNTSKGHIVFFHSIIIEWRRLRIKPTANQRTIVQNHWFSKNNSPISDLRLKRPACVFCFSFWSEWNQNQVDNANVLGILEVLYFKLWGLQKIYWTWVIQFNNDGMKIWIWPALKWKIMKLMYDIYIIYKIQN